MRTPTHHVTSQRERDNPDPDTDTSPLTLIDAAFLDLSVRKRPPAPRLPASLLGDPPDEPWTPADVRARLQLRIESADRLEIDGEHITDRVWWHVAQRARTERGDWLTVAVGMAIGGLRGMIPNYTRPGGRRYLHSDMITRVVEVLAGEEPDPFDITSPYLFNRLMDRARYAALRSPQRSTAPRLEASEAVAEMRHDTQASRDPYRPPSRPGHGDPLIVLAGLVRNRIMNRLDAALLARAYVGGWTQAEAFTAVRATLPDDVGTLTDTALRGRLERARDTIRTLIDQPTNPQQAHHADPRPNGAAAQSHARAPAALANTREH